MNTEYPFPLFEYSLINKEIFYLEYEVVIVIGVRICICC